MEILVSLMVMLVCLLFEAFFSGSEIGVVSADQMKLRHAGRQGFPRCQAGAQNAQETGMAAFHHPGGDQYRRGDQYHGGDRPDVVAVRRAGQLAGGAGSRAADLGVRRDCAQKRVPAAGGHHHPLRDLRPALFFLPVLPDPAGVQLYYPGAYPPRGGAGRKSVHLA